MTKQEHDAQIARLIDSYGEHGLAQMVIELTAEIEEAYSAEQKGPSLEELMAEAPEGGLPSFEELEGLAEHRPEQAEPDTTLKINGNPAIKMPDSKTEAEAMIRVAQAWLDHNKAEK